MKICQLSSDMGTQPLLYRIYWPPSTTPQRLRYVIWPRSMIVPPVPADPGGQRSSLLRAGFAPQDAVYQTQNRGARINEALVLTRGDFSLAALKLRGESAAHGAIRAPSSAVPHRRVQLSDPQYVATLKIPLEGCNSGKVKT